MADNNSEHKEENANESQGNQPPARVYGKPFTSTDQPTGAQKSLGWWKKKKGRELLRAMLDLPFDGAMDDPVTGQKVDNKIRKQVAQYMNLPEELVTVEMVLFVKQIALAAQKNDTGAFNTVIENAYGKPKETIITELDEKPVININIQAGVQDAPPIAESEEELTGKSPENLETT